MKRKVRWASSEMIAILPEDKAGGSRPAVPILRPAGLACLCYQCLFIWELSIPKKSLGERWGSLSDKCDKFESTLFIGNEAKKNVCISNFLFISFPLNLLMDIFGKRGHCVLERQAVKVLEMVVLVNKIIMPFVSLWTLNRALKGKGAACVAGSTSWDFMSSGMLFWDLIQNSNVLILLFHLDPVYWEVVFTRRGDISVLC